MRSLTLLVLLGILAAIPSRARGQDAEPPDGTPIEAADVSGIAKDQLSPGLQRDIDALAGEPLERERLDRLARRIEEEHPEVVAAVRTVARPDGQARVIFLAARISDDRDLVSNINARYIVESVEIHGVPDADISTGLRDRLQALVGRRLDSEEADALIEDLKAEKPGYDISRRISRGTMPGQIHVVFDFDEAERLRWIPFAPSRSKYVYHSDEGWSGLQDIPIGDRNHRVTIGLAFDDNDTLVEEYSGARLRFEARHIGTERLAASLEATWLNDTWREPTLLALAANPSIPEPYRNRLTVEPSVTVALTPHVRVIGGVSISDLESLHHSPASQMASSVIGAITYSQRWQQHEKKGQRVEASYEVRTSADWLGSDLHYTRQLARGRYRFDRGHNTIAAEVFGGGISGAAPLFERFSLGDSTTLRGWNKFEIAPAGGDHVFHQSLEYRFYGVGMFLDAGSIRDSGREQRLRASTGFGVQTDNVFLTVAFPLDTTRSGVAFMMGVRF